VIFIIAYLFVGTVIAITNPEYAITGLSVLAAFIVMYFIFHKKGNKKDDYRENDLLRE